MSKQNFSEVADLSGTRCLVTIIRGSRYRFLAAHDFDTAATEAETAQEPEPEPNCRDQDHRTAHYLGILVDAARHDLSSKQFEAVEELIVRKKSLSEVAAERGGTAEGWRQRLAGSGGKGGIKDKAPELYALWLFRNRVRHDIGEVMVAIQRAVDKRRRT